MTEQRICLVSATVMIYNDQERQWYHAGDHTNANSPSDVNILHNEATNSYRIVAVKVDNKSDVTVNMNIYKNLKYHVATPTFHQWRCDKKTVYGLNFSSPEQANRFQNQMTVILEELKTGKIVNSQVLSQNQTRNQSQNQNHSQNPQINAQNVNDDQNCNADQNSNQQIQNNILNNNYSYNTEVYNEENQGNVEVLHQSNINHSSQQSKPVSNNSAGSNSSPLNGNVNNSSLAIQQQNYQRMQAIQQHQNSLYHGRPQIPNVRPNNSSVSSMQRLVSESEENNPLQNQNNQNIQMNHQNSQNIQNQQNLAEQINYSNTDMLRELDRIQKYEQERALQSHYHKPFRQSINNNTPSQNQSNLQSQLSTKLKSASNTQRDRTSQNLENQFNLGTSTPNKNHIPVTPPNLNQNIPDAPPCPGPPPMVNSSNTLSIKDQIKKQTSQNNSYSQMEGKLNSYSQMKRLEQNDKNSNSPRPLSSGDFLLELRRKLESKTEPSPHQNEPKVNSVNLNYKNGAGETSNSRISNSRNYKQLNIVNTQNSQNSSSSNNVILENNSQAIDYNKMKSELKKEICEELRSVVRQELTLFFERF